MQNLAYFLTRAGRHHASRPAIFFKDQQHDYAWFNAEVSRLASALTGRGLKPGDRVGLVMENEPRGLISMFALLRAGLVMVPMNAKLLPLEHAFMLQDCGARALIVSGSYLVGLMAIRDRLPPDILIIAMNIGGRSDVNDFDSLVLSGSDQFSDVGVDADALAWIFYTSGTTGKPKGAMLSHRNLITMVNTQLIEICPVMPTDRVAYVAPLSHGNGLLAFQHVARGAAHVFPAFSGFRPDQFFAFVERYKVTSVFMVPTMILRMIEDDSHGRYDISSLHTVVYGGAPMYVDRLKEAIRVFGPIFSQLFAQAEAPMACTCLPKADHRLGDVKQETRLGSAGRECHMVEVRVFDDQDNELPCNEAGEIVIRGDLVMKGYWNNPDASRETLRNGWLHTGDIGFLDDDGYLFITDRKRDLVITGGSNVYPREIEEVLYRHEAILEAAAFGVPDPYWGERIVAAVVVKPNCALTAADVIGWCSRHLARFKKPSEVRFVDELPKSGYGKILKREIKAKLFPPG